MLSLLDRSIAREVAVLLVFYSISFLALIAIAVTVPLIRGGAPLLDVLLFLPNQLAFPATLALPLALITAVLSTLARMREDGELTALMAAGISSWRVVRATLPLALITTLLVAWLAHQMLPVAYRNFTAGRASLLRQAMATKVARQEPIYQSRSLTGVEQTTLAALEASGNHLGHLFARRVSDTGEIWLGYAPQAVWDVQHAPAPPPTLPDLPPEMLEKIGPIEAIDIPGYDPDAQASSLRLDLLQARMLQHSVDTQRLWRGREDEYVIWQRMQTEDAQTKQAENPPYPVTIAWLPRWSLTLEDLTIGAENPPDAKSTSQLALEIRTIQSYMDAFVAPQGMSQQMIDDLFRGSTATLRELQLAYHLRHMLSLAILAWWLFAAGIALSLPARNRLTAVGLGLMTVMISVIPAFALVKGMRGMLAVNPALLLWAPSLLLALIGALLLWRRR